MRHLLIAALALSSLVSAAGGQQPVFRANAEVVFVDVSVTQGNRPVVGLRSTDFSLADNGVPQRVDATAIETVPLDVSLFLDTSGSTAGTLPKMKDNIRAIAAMLRPSDRFRLLTIGQSVYQTVPWTNAGQPLGPLDIKPVIGISLVYDAVFAAMSHTAGAGRRHLVVALTDGEDRCSLISPAQIRDLIGRTDAVLHWVPIRGATFQGTRAWCHDEDDADRSALDALATGTGGRVHAGFVGTVIGPDPVKAFKAVLDDYRQSYVLRYTPEGVAEAGWHSVTVAVPSAKYQIRSKAGYFSP